MTHQLLTFPTKYGLNGSILKITTTVPSKLFFSYVSDSKYCKLKKEKSETKVTQIQTGIRLSPLGALISLHVFVQSLIKTPDRVSVWFHQNNQISYCQKLQDCPNATQNRMCPAFSFCLLDVRTIIKLISSGNIQRKSLALIYL